MLESFGVASQLPRCAWLAVEELVRRGIVDKPLFHRVPAQRASQLIAKVRQVTDRRRAMAGFRRTNRLRAAADTRQPVAYLVAGPVQADVGLPLRVLEVFRWFAVHFVAIDVKDAIGAPEGAAARPAVKHLDPVGIDE